MHFWCFQWNVYHVCLENSCLICGWNQQAKYSKWPSGDVLKIILYKQRRCQDVTTAHIALQHVMLSTRASFEKNNSNIKHWCHTSDKHELSQLLDVGEFSLEHKDRKQVGAIQFNFVKWWQDDNEWKWIATLFGISLLLWILTLMLTFLSMYLQVHKWSSLRFGTSFRPNLIEWGMETKIDAGT